jgi:DnaK suppressor protein
VRCKALFIGPMSDRKDIDEKALKQQLIDRKVELERLVTAHHDDTRPVVLDQTTVGRLSRMDEIQNQAMSVETERRRIDETHRIDAALARMEEDEFGYCMTCGDEIEKKRLELDPAIPTCVGCAK